MSIYIGNPEFAEELALGEANGYLTLVDPGVLPDSMIEAANQTWHDEWVKWLVNGGIDGAEADSRAMIASVVRAALESLVADG